jgi:hypothetical protein
MTPTTDKRSLALLARTIYRQLEKSGFSNRDAITLATHLLECVTSEIRDRRDATATASSSLERRAA